MILDPAPPSFSDAHPLDIDGWPIILADRLLTDGRHLVLGDSDGSHHLWLRNPFGGRPVTYMIVRDTSIEVRRQAAWRLDRRLAGAAPSRRRGAFRPSPFQRQRLNLLLDVLDLMLSPEGPTTSHEIARRVIYRDLRVDRGMDWRTSSERRHTLRLMKQARALLNGGYRDLLRGVLQGVTKAGG